MSGQPNEAIAPELRVSDVERDQAIADLQEHCVAGRLTFDELAQRVAAVYAARTKSSLQEVLYDLPFAPSPAASAPTIHTSPSMRQFTRWTVAFMGSVSRRGRWRVGQQNVSVALMANCELDLRQATLEGPDPQFTAVALMGSTTIIVPEGVHVELSGFAPMGSLDSRVRDVPGQPDLPVTSIRVIGFAVMGSITVKSRPRDEQPLGELFQDGIRRRIE